MEDEDIFKDTSETVRKALVEVHAKSDQKTKVAQEAFQIALNKLI